MKKGLIFVCVLLLAVTVSGCFSDASDQDKEEKRDNQDESRVQMELFMADSGLPHPEGVDPSDNKFINIVEDAAQVDLKVDVPSWADFQTRFNLLMASGQLPDVVHTFEVDETYELARQGAFIDLKEYYDNSPQIQKYITEEMMEFAKDPVTGNYWRIPMASASGPQGSGIHMMRGELIDEYNNGVWPGSVEEWIDFFRVVKQEIPEAVILSNAPSGDQAIGGGGSVIYYWYGALPYQWRIQDGEIIPNVLLPEFREATEVMRELYAEGLLDREFATNDADRYNEKVINNTVLLQVNGADQIAPGAAYYRTDPSLPDHAREYKWLFAPPLNDYPDVLQDTKYAEPKQGFPITTHGLYIPESTENPDKAWEVIEAFASDELYEAVFWGYEGEGVTYNTENGQRIPTDQFGPGTEDYWSLHLAIIFGFDDGQEGKKASHLQSLGEEYHQEVYDSVAAIDDLATKNGINDDGFGNMPGYTPQGEVFLKRTDSVLAINSFTVEAIMGTITMEEFDQRVQEWESEFREVIYGPMQEFLDENKEELIGNGVLQAGW